MGEPPWGGGVRAQVLEPHTQLRVTVGSGVGADVPLKLNVGGLKADAVFSYAVRGLLL